MNKCTKVRTDPCYGNALWRALAGPHRRPAVAITEKGARLLAAAVMELAALDVRTMQERGAIVLGGEVSARWTPRKCKRNRREGRCLTSLRCYDNPGELQRLLEFWRPRGGAEKYLKLMQVELNGYPVTGKSARRALGLTRWDKTEVEDDDEWEIDCAREI